MSKKKQKLRVEYSSNNSSGYWWLNDKEWAALEKAGWKVQWGGLYFCGSTFSFRKRPRYLKKLCKDQKNCSGHRLYKSYKEAINAGEDARFLGALAQHATRCGLSLKDAIAEFEKITGADSSALGCPCCGQPHYFHLVNE